MSRSARTAARLSALVATAGLLTIGFASPALAFGPPSVTVIPTTTGEDPLTDLSVTCPVASTSAGIVMSGTNNGLAQTYGAIAVTLDGLGEGSTAGYYLESFFDRDTDVSIVVTCRDLANASTGDNSATPTVYRVPTTNAASATPATLAANASLVATGNCGTATDIFQLTVYAYSPTGGAPLAGFPVTVPYAGGADYSVNLGTPSTLGVAAGSSVDVQVLCVTNTPDVHRTSARLTTTAITAAVAAPVILPAAAPALAATGPALVLPIGGLAAVLLLAGLGTVVLRRRALHQP